MNTTDTPELDPALDAYNAAMAAPQPRRRDRNAYAAWEAAKIAAWVALYDQPELAAKEQA